MSDANDCHPVDVLVEEYVARYRAGDNPSIADYVERHPEWAGEIRELFSAATLLEAVKGPRRTACPVQEQAPQRIGDFRIVREVGRGGMGVVYEAEQLSLGRRVALKVLPSQPRLSAELLERFRREAQAAARLHHTNIVPVFGVGEHEGMPYYVMQFIPGLGLDRVLARFRRQRTGADSAADPGPMPFPAPDDPAYFRHVARLGAQVADALAHAHAQGILHRDIKPANLLLDDRGDVWITDFGLAKLVEQDDLTRPGEVAGTLRYCAPERFQGQCDARADVYALGLTLYELLALRPAYDESDPGRLLMQASHPRIVRPRAHNPAVPRDLETVVRRALAPEPSRRYPTAAELAADLRRFLDDRPVRARPAGVLEHAWRWCRRNPAVACLSAALVTACVLGFSGVVWKWREASAHLAQANQAGKHLREALGREEQESQRADGQRQRAEGNLDLALEAFERIAVQLGLSRSGAPLDSEEEAPVQPIVSPEAATILQDLVRFYERFAARNTEDPRLKRDTARALRHVGVIRIRLGQHAEAREALEKAASLFAGMPGEALERARVHNDLGLALRASGRVAEAARAFQQALEVLEGEAGRDATGRLEQARAHTLLGMMQWRLQSLSAADRSQRTALKILDGLTAESPDHPEYRHAQARVYHNLGLVLSPKHRSEALEARRKAQEILKELAAESPGVPDYQAELAEVLLSLTPRLLLPWQAKEGEKRCRRAVELAAALTAKYPAVPGYQSLQARAQHRLGQVQQAMNKRSEALASYRQAVSLHRDLQAKFPQVPGYHLPAAEARLSLGELLLRQRNQLDEAETVLRQSLAELEKAVPFATRNPFARALLARHYRALSETLRGQGKKAEADKAARRANALGVPWP